MNRVSNIFSQILQLVQRHLFERAVRRHQGERHARLHLLGPVRGDAVLPVGAVQESARDQRRAAAQRGQAEASRTHRAPSHSTLAYANRHRSWRIYETLFGLLLEHLQVRLTIAAPSPALKLSGKLLRLDSTVIDLCASVFDWAHYTTTKGAVQLHLLLDHDGLLPHYAVITEGKRSDIAVSRTLRLPPRTLRLPPRSLLVFDRGYTDYEWFSQLSDDGVWLVIRLKQNASYDLAGADAPDPIQTA